MICGCDEAGRGALAGPVIAAAVVLPVAVPIHLKNIKDSKQLTKKQREELYDLIIDSAIDYTITRAELKEIVVHNILRASLRAMQRAVNSLQVSPEKILIDGPYVPDETDSRMTAIVKGDTYITAISAASILAKVYRDRLMHAMHVEDSRYHFDKHKGYPTKLHYQKLRIHGPSSNHRSTFRLTQ